MAGMNKRAEQSAILIGNSFPLGLIRRRVVIQMVRVEELRRNLEICRLYSFWGHANTLKAAGALAGFDLTPASQRPVLRLSAALLPMLDGVEFSECWVLSPEYKEHLRPPIGAEVDEDFILEWSIKRMEWR